MHGYDTTQWRSGDKPGGVGGSIQNWQPPFVRGEKLRQWASATAEVTATVRLAQPRSAASATQLAAEIGGGAGYAIDQSPQKSDRACHSACPGCCHARISVMPPEAITIADSLRRSRPAEEVARIRDRASEISQQTAEMDNLQYAQAMIRCPLLADDDTCLVYNRRPIACRAWCSLSVERCNACYMSGAADDSIPLDGHAHSIGQGVRAGLANAIKSAGLDGAAYQLCSALVVALDNANAAEQWIKGKEVFAACERCA